jgi:hypothetical protein
VVSADLDMTAHIPVSSNVDRNTPESENEAGLGIKILIFAHSTPFRMAERLALLE